MIIVEGSRKEHDGYLQLGLSYTGFAALDNNGESVRMPKRGDTRIVTRVTLLSVDHHECMSTLLRAVFLFLISMADIYHRTTLRR